MNAKLTQDELQAIKERHRKAHIGTLGKPIDDTFHQINDIKKLLTEIERLQAEVHEHSAHNGQLIATHVIPTKEENKRLKAEVEKQDAENSRLRKSLIQAEKYLRECYGHDSRDDFKITRAFTHVRRGLYGGDND